VSPTGEAIEREIHVRTTGLCMSELKSALEATAIVALESPRVVVTIDELLLGSDGEITLDLHHFDVHSLVVHTTLKVTGSLNDIAALVAGHGPAEDSHSQAATDATVEDQAARPAQHGLEDSSPPGGKRDEHEHEAHSVSTAADDCDAASEASPSRHHRLLESAEHRLDHAAHRAAHALGSAEHRAAHALESGRHAVEHAGHRAAHATSEVVRSCTTKTFVFKVSAAISMSKAFGSKTVAITITDLDIDAKAIRAMMHVKMAREYVERSLSTAASDAVADAENKAMEDFEQRSHACFCSP